MLNIFKMDMRRMLKSKAFYICLFFMNLVTGTMIFTGMIPDFAAVMGSGSTDMMSAMMGIGMVFMIISILFSIFICGDFSSGFAKNIFTRHANPLHYFGGKLLSLIFTGTISMIIYMIISMLLLLMRGQGVDLPGGISGLLTFLIEKIFVIGIFAALILTLSLYSRKIIVGIIMGVVVATGSIVNLLTMLALQFELAWVPNILQFSISSISSKASLVFNSTNFSTILIGSIIWIILFSLLGSHAIKTKDV